MLNTTQLVLCIHGSKFQLKSVDSADANPTDRQGQLYSLHYTIFHKGLCIPYFGIDRGSWNPGTTVYPTYPSRVYHMKPIQFVLSNPPQPNRSFKTAKISTLLKVCLISLVISNLSTLSINSLSNQPVIS